MRHRATKNPRRCPGLSPVLRANAASPDSSATLRIVHADCFRRRGRPACLPTSRSRRDAGALQCARTKESPRAVLFFYRYRTWTEPGSGRSRTNILGRCNLLSETWILMWANNPMEARWVGYGTLWPEPKQAKLKASPSSSSGSRTWPVVQELLAHGADPRSTDAVGTPEQRAAEAGHDQIARFLRIQRGLVPGSRA